ncbi:T9SS type A sorting domain-containing protein [Psychroserpens ponticola]|uniref:T9SS type A sorting domain-containing protein n=1 Tax=Psychroserpens ponticola TaxID=2932268 RepID=A0ABY7RWM5_9FLAO|nr:T9SS type A sorting domain-containing protein [Psychroserpens ponticola]WCO01398.1 T9SS type A sorting domain-containing protein [Psychroserpens ponticola]
MRQFYFFLLLAFLSLNANAQLTYVPDDNFEQALINLGYDSGPLDDFVPTINISGVSILNVDDKGISDLTGIEDFAALTELRCYTNSIANLDVSANTQLIYLDCSANSLTSLDVSSNTQLQFLNCGINAIMILNLNQNSLLSNFYATNNQLTALSIRNGAGNIITNFNTINNPNLTCIQVDNATYSTNNWTDIDMQSSFSEDCHYGETYVPDDNFEQALIDLGYDAGALDDYVPTANINTVGTLSVSNKGISDLTGIEDFEDLTTLFCGINLLTSLDVSNNAQLSYLNCSFNSNLTNLDVSANQALTTLSCDLTGLNSLDVSTNIALTVLRCDSNNLTSIDISTNTALATLSCQSNNLSSLNLVNNPFLEILNCNNNDLIGLNLKNGNNTIITDFDAIGNPNLTCIQVEDAAYSTTNWTNIDAQTSFSEDCYYNDTYVPDDNFEQALIDLGYDSGPLDNYVLTANINTLTSLDVSNKSISDLTGIEDFVALIVLQCNGNNLASMDFSNNTLLETLYCYGNNSTSLEISNNISLKLLSCHSNNFTDLDTSNNVALESLSTFTGNLISLDLSNNTSLNYLKCSNNNLTSINVQNGNNAIITTFDTIGNPNLTCIEVNDATYSTTNWTDIDAQTSFSEDCHYGETYVPDDNFEQALIDLGYDTGVLDDYVPTANINTVTNLNVDSNSISDLTGIEGFVALTDLSCYNNSLSSLDVSSNTALTFLVCSFNSLSSLDISSNTALTFLACHSNSLTSIDVSNNTALESLSCTNNSISSLDVSTNTALRFLFCHDNSINSLDISNNIALVSLFCYDNNLTGLDLINNTLLEYLDCNNNNLISLNIKNGNNTIITTFNATGNPNLSCIEVDDAAYSTTNWTNVDMASIFSEDCATLSLESINEHTFSVYPNPVNNELNISSTTNGHYNILNVNGQTLKQGVLVNGNNNINLSQLKSGLYFLNIKNDTGSILKKVIKK